MMQWQDANILSFLGGGVSIVNSLVRCTYVLLLSIYQLILVNVLEMELNSIKSDDMSMVGLVYSYAGVTTAVHNP